MTIGVYHACFQSRHPPLFSHGRLGWSPTNPKTVTRCSQFSCPFSECSTPHNGTSTWLLGCLLQFGQSTDLAFRDDKQGCLPFACWWLTFGHFFGLFDTGHGHHNALHPVRLLGSGDLLRVHRAALERVGEPLRYDTFWFDLLELVRGAFDGSLWHWN